jgi:hypothetical protein
MSEKKSRIKNNLNKKQKLSTEIILNTTTETKVKQLNLTVKILLL